MENEKVILPKNVAEVLDNIGTNRMNSFTPFGFLCRFDSVTSPSHPDGNKYIYRWFSDSDNQWKLLQALEYGYEAEKEQLYYIRFSGLSLSDNPTSFLNLNKSELFIGSKRNSEDYKTKFTMSQIKSLGEKYVPFAVKVEEIDGEE